MHIQNQTPNPTNPNPTPEDVAKAVVKTFRPNLAQRIRDDAALATVGFLAGMFLFKGLGWWRYLIGSGFSILGLGVSETYHAISSWIDEDRFNSLIESAYAVYRAEGEEQAEEYLRNELARFHSQQMRERKEWEDRLGDLNAVAQTAAEARQDAEAASKFVSQASEQADVLITRIESVDEKVDSAVTKSNKFFKSLGSRLTKMEKRSVKAGVSVESTKTAKPAKKRHTKKGAKAA